MVMKLRYVIILLEIFIFTYISYAQNGGIYHDLLQKEIVISDSNQRLVVRLNYLNGCKISQLAINGKNVLSDSGIYTDFRTKGGAFSSFFIEDEVQIEELNDKIFINDIVYGDYSISVNESWSFSLENDKIVWNINRRYSNIAELEEMSLPQWHFTNMSVWKGGILDNGGMVWCKYLKNLNDTYGVHTGGVTLWNQNTGEALRIKAISKRGKLATKYSQGDNNEFVIAHFLTDEELEPRYNLSRFVNEQSDIFAPFDVQKGDVNITIEMEYVDYDSAYSRGHLSGIDIEAVRELMNTTGRYGVVDNAIVGANGWTSNWKCLHEPFFAQIGLALNDSNYVKNMSETLDREREYAITNDGRVLSRWHNVDDDQVPGTFNYKTGYYEAMWGYTIDSQTSYIINTAEQFNLCGDTRWLRTHKLTCEKVLEWLIKRDSNGNGIFEMMNESIKERKSSDWLDIVWASFENAFVNAQMYEALNLWADCERVLGDKLKADYYITIAQKLKENFNKSIYEGGFWCPEKKQYIYWRDKDGSIHGDNLVTPVNFAVIAFGLCDDKRRISEILHQIEKRMLSENLFHWPLCFDSFKEEEVSERNWPFPNYENGDIFPTWGYLGVRAYVGYDKQIALKYICNILKQYRKDGLSFQRYNRKTQEGIGSDILAGICTSVTALYRDIYGIRPKWNRMGLEPNMLTTLNGTEFNYNLRDTLYCIRLSVDDYEMETDCFLVRSSYAFGASFQKGTLCVYPQNEEKILLKVIEKSSSFVKVNLKHYRENDILWSLDTTGDYQFIIEGLNPSLKYKLSIQDKTTLLDVSKDGKVSFTYSCKDITNFRLYV